jgi:hypothetical protein
VKAVKEKTVADYDSDAAQSLRYGSSLCVENINWILSVVPAVHTIYLPDSIYTK